MILNWRNINTRFWSKKVKKQTLFIKQACACSIYLIKVLFHFCCCHFVLVDWINKNWNFNSYYTNLYILFQYHVSPELTEKIVGRWGSGVLSLPHTPGLTPGFCGVVVFYCFVLVHVCSVTALQCLYPAYGSFYLKLSANLGTNWPFVFIKDEIQVRSILSRLVYARRSFRYFNHCWFTPVFHYINRTAMYYVQTYIPQ